ncbi:MAG: hypothetical protein ACOX8S_01705 [Christensenellales bacterium]
MSVRLCVLREDEICSECGDCMVCDLDSAKICDDCMKCIEGDCQDGYKKIEIGPVRLEGDEYEDWLKEDI